MRLSYRMRVLINPYTVFLITTKMWLLIAMEVKSISTTRSTYIVHMDKSHMPESSNSHHHWYSSIVDSLKDASLHSTSPSIIYSYDTVFHGFSATLSQEELENLKNCPGFVSAHTDKPVIAHTTHSPQFLSLSPSAGIWPAANFGEDIIIGVIDSGVWPESESFNDHGMSPNIPSKWKGKCEEGQEFNSSMCNRKLIGARFFNKGMIAANPNLTIDMNSPRDTTGHGTHTASTAAGNTVQRASFFGYAKGTATGIAPRARVAAYKVLWGSEGVGSDTLAGMDRAVKDGIDVLSASIHFSRFVPLYEDQIAIASFAAMERGVVVSMSAGNEGPSSGTLFNGIPWVITVAAGSMDRSFGGTVKLGNGDSIRGWTLFPARVILENKALVYNKTLSACNSTSLLYEAQLVAVIVCDDTWPVSQQIVAVSAAEVIGAIFISNDSVPFELQHVTCPSVIIHPQDAPKLITYARSNNDPFVSIKFQETFTGTKPAPTVSSYSSRGPSQNYQQISKPDIMAPGTRVLAAWVPNNPAAFIGYNYLELSSDFNIHSGTSMSCPHISGVAALLKSTYPEWSPAAIKSAMMTTANPLDNTGSPIIDDGDVDFQFASPLAMGSGQVVLKYQH